MRNLTRAVAVAAVLSTGCGDSSTGLKPNALPVTISGTIQVRNATTVPANARVLVLWGVSATSSDYAYIFGEGTQSNGQFSVTFTQNPPAAALNNNRLGVALVIVTTDQTLAQGQVPGNYAFPGLLGAMEDHSIIFINEAGAQTGVTWESRFPAGYSLGEVERSTTGFDSFKRVALNLARVVIDAINNINVPNWT
jgi:hypothetical protein